MLRMVSRRALTALLFAQLLALGLSAQESAEFGRSTSGELLLTPKGPAQFSGSLQMSLSSGGDVFGRGSSPGYGMTAGGTLIQDRLWFFASGSRQPVIAQRTAIDLPQNVATRAIGGRISGQLGTNQDFAAFFDSERRPQLSTIGASPFASSVPSSFLSLHYTGIISNNMFFSASVSRSGRTANGVMLTPAQ